MAEAARELGIIDQSKFITLDELMKEMKKEAHRVGARVPSCHKLVEHMAQWHAEKWGGVDGGPRETALKNWMRELRQLYE
jgi:hypothetical protein